MRINPLNGVGLMCPCAQTAIDNATSLLAVLAVGQGDISGVISQSALGATGTVGLTKQGAGTLILSGARKSKA